FTRDLSLRLQLVNDNDKLYFFTEESNPFTANSVSTLLRQNTNVIDARIGRGNYDLGHVYTQGGNNGVARLRSTCGTSRGAGATSHVRPENDPFNVDYVAHEMGHQLGGNHTQNNECNYSPQAGMEPGSASTIMGYAGICSPNVQGRSDDYFHGRSIEEITTWLETGDGASCANVISTTITSPQVDSISDYLVPRGTPLKLVGSASGDANLSYNWEQYDVDQAVMPPKEDNATGPLFRSFPARSDGVRYLPRFPDVLNGNDPMWETLPMVERSMNFRLTVLNQNTTYGCASEENVRLDVAGDKAPFLVTDPADANQWSRGQIAQVQWDVAGTDAAAYRSPTVDVLLTTDDGTSFDTLARSVANNGLAEVRVPDLETTNARILVRSVDNVFYNISDEDFSIVDSVGAPTVTIENLTSPGMAGCFVDVDSVNFNFLTTSAGGATAALRPNLEGMPDGVTATFLPDSIRPGGRLRVILKGFSSLDQGQYDGTLTLRSAEATLTRELSVTKLGDSNSAGPQPIAPLDEAADTRPTLQAKDTQADNFEIQISTEENFSTLIYHVLRSTPSFTPPTPLAPSTQYFWRIRGKSNQGGCTASNWATASFRTGSCFTYRGAIDSVVISDGPPTQIAEIPVEVPLFGIVRDVDVLQLDVTHSYLSDLSIELEGPSGRTVSLFNRNCSSNDNLLLSFDDEAVTRTYNCPPNSSTLFVKPPGTSLDVFDEDESRGTWTLRVTDNAINDGGMLNSVGLKLCLEGDFSLPVTFISFVATGRKGDILLRWRTEDERENAGFYVERAEEITPSTAWTELGFVPAGTDYVFTDQTARPGIDYYYRLRQTDRDGRVNYSEVRTARIGGEATTSLLLYPNPTNGRLHYRSIGPDGDNREYSLYNANGQRLRVGQLTTTSGSIDLSAFPAGFYLLRTDGKAFRIVRR
ncbi:MAG: reprolysin-like metallopeptidase, partial [Bacteroidota bacterium]